MTLASCGGTKDAGQQQDAATLIQRSDIKIEGKRMTPEALWAMVRIGSVAVSPDEKKIAYTVSYYSVPQNKSNSEVFVMNADGSGNTQITHDAWQEGQPTWFKDGKKLTGETGKTLTVSTTKAAAAAEYVCKITFFNDKVDGKDYVTTVSNKVSVTVEEAPVADMNVLVNYVEANGTVVAQETTSAKAADAVNGYVTIKAKDPDGYTVKGLKSKMVEFKAGANVTVEFTVEAN